MALWLPIRKYNRTQSVRIGSGANAQRVRAVIRNTDTDSVSGNINWIAPPTYINIEDTAIRKQFTYHSAIGAVYTVGPEIHVDSGTTLGQGGRVDITSLLNGNDATGIAVISVGSVAVLGTSGVPVYSTNTNPATITVAVPASGWTGTNVTSVLVQINTNTGAVTTKVANGASPAPTTPTVDSNNIALASFTVTRVGNTSANTASAVTSLKPY